MSFTVEFASWGASVGASGGFATGVGDAVKQSDVNSQCAGDAVIDVAGKSMWGGVVGGALGGVAGAALDVLAFTGVISAGVATGGVVVIGAVAAKQLTRTG